MISLLAAAPLAAAAHEHAPDSAAHHKDAPTSFATQPKPGTWAKCSVSGDVFRIQKDTLFATHEGRVYAFCCPDCQPDFLKEPAKYADPKKS